MCVCTLLKFTQSIQLFNCTVDHLKTILSSKVFIKLSSSIETRVFEIRILLWTFVRDTHDILRLFCPQPIKHSSATTK